MRRLTVRLPEALVANIEADARLRKITKSDVVRERLQYAVRPACSSTESVADLIGSVGGLPADLSRRKKLYLNVTAYGRKRAGRRTR
jgi:hypothetical protein